MSVHVQVPAKVNLYLGVGARRLDGYHGLATVFQAVSLFDDVIAEPADGLSVHVDGEGAAGVPTDDANLAVRAARALAAHVGVEPLVKLRIRKGIPVAGGMAGGSADAAATLVACDALWGCALAPSDLAAIAAGLGSDVPFALMGGTAMGSGRGEQLTQVLGRGTFHWVFALADGGLSTPKVYAELDVMRGDVPVPEPAVPDAVMAALRGGDAEQLGAALSNDLERVALKLRPELRRTLDAGRESGAIGALVCGSGPTCAFLAAGEVEALRLATTLSASGTCRTVRRAHGPVRGARVV